MLNDILQIFVTEARELIDDIENGLLALEGDDDPNEELVHSLFRSAHTIKGSAGVVGLDDIVSFTHNVESIFEKVRDKSLSLDKALSGILLKCNDHISVLLDMAENEEDVDDETKAKGAELIKELLPFLGDEASEDGASVDEHSGDSSNASSGDEIIFVKFPESCFVDGLDPLSIVNYLSDNHSVEYINWHDAYVPSIKEMTTESAEKCSLVVELKLQGLSDDEFTSTFEFIASNSTIVRLTDATEDHFNSKLRDIDDDGFRSFVEHCLRDAGNWPKSSEISQTGDKKAKQKQQNANSKDQRIMRVPAFRLDDLVNQLGELVIASASLQEKSMKFGDTGLAETVNEIQSLVDDIQGSALQLRMVQIGETFNRFNRVVRDVSEGLGKSVNLTIRGAETEVDKSMVEGISDPLMHLVRNALDHGIEAPEERLIAGKPEVGSILLSAYHDSGSIVLEIKDDGKGIDRAKVLKKAISKGIVTENSQLSDKDIDSLIFHPGFSTADEVSNLSGRGVGMDVVHQNIQALRGSVEIESEEHKGTTFRLRLPLTLAIIDGFLVRVGKAKFVIPLDLVNECIELPEKASTVDAFSDYIDVREEVLPFVYLNKVFDLEYSGIERRSIIVVKHGVARAGLVVDEVLGEFQTVIKPLGKLFEFMEGVSGSSILGSGEIALILDVPTLVSMHIDKIQSSQKNTEVTR